MYERPQVIEKKSDTRKASSAPKAQNTEFSPSTSTPADRILSLQRTIGNQAVQRLFKGVGGPLSTVGGQIQPKLTIGQPNDIYEQEADRVAEQVMRMPDSQVRPKEDTPIIQRISSIVNTPGIHPDIECDLNTQQGRGQPLPNNTRAFFEPRFGYDFGDVRIHTDAQADKFNRALNARAFTLSQDIYISKQDANLNSQQGQRLLAHELTHVVQQGGMNTTNRKQLVTAQPDRIRNVSKISKKMIQCVRVGAGLNYDVISYYGLPDERRTAHRVLITMSIMPDASMEDISGKIVRVLRHLVMTEQADRAPGLVGDMFFQRQLRLHRAAYRQQFPLRFRTYTVPIVLHRDAALTEDVRGYRVNRIRVETSYGQEPEAPEQLPEPIPPQREERDAWLVAARVDTQRLSEAARDMLIQYPNLHPEYLPRPRVLELQIDGTTSLYRVRNVAELYDPNMFIRAYLYTPITRDYDHFCQRVQGFREDVRASAQRIMAEVSGCEQCVTQSCIIIKEEWYFPLQRNAHSVYHFSVAGP